MLRFLEAGLLQRRRGNPPGGSHQDSDSALPKVLSFTRSRAAGVARSHMNVISP
jgi:hypothetical protein